jgi:hypothetical protein
MIGMVFLCSSAAFVYAEEPQEESETEDERAEPNADRSAVQQEIETAVTAACNHAVECALEDVPDSVRGMIDRSRICRMYNRYEGSDEDYDQACVDAALAYLNCVESTPCEAFKSESGQICPEESERARVQCEAN